MGLLLCLALLATGSGDGGSGDDGSGDDGPTGSPTAMPTVFPATSPTSVPTLLSDHVDNRGRTWAALGSATLAPAYDVRDPDPWFHGPVAMTNKGRSSEFNATFPGTELFPFGQNAFVWFL